MKEKTIVLLLGIAFFCFQACKNNIATYHLNQFQMQHLLLDIQAAEAYCTIVTADSIKKGNPKNIDSLAQYYTDIFAHYHINKEQFNQNLDWYKQHPGDLDSVYNNLLTELSRLEGIYKAGK
jgi:hypothetical protein